MILAQVAIVRESLQQLFVCVSHISFVLVDLCSSRALVKVGQPHRTRLSAMGRSRCVLVSARTIAALGGTASVCGGAAP